MLKLEIKMDEAKIAAEQKYRVAVSYTHLDVYKRQPNSCQWCFCLRTFYEIYATSKYKRT